MLVYSAGLRIGEMVKLGPEDIDSKRMLIHVSSDLQPKGGISEPGSSIPPNLEGYAKLNSDVKKLYAIGRLKRR